MKRQPIILLDQDGTLFDYNAELYKRWADRHPEEFDRHHVPLDRVPYDLTNFYTGEIRTHLKEIEREPGFFGSLPPIPGAVDATQELVARGYHVCICTRPSKSTIAVCALDKFRLVERVLGPSWMERMMVVRDKTFAYGDVLIDDKPQVEGVNPSPCWTHVLYDQPYNRTVKRPRVAWNADWRTVISSVLEEREAERAQAGREERARSIPLPEVGDDIYVPSELYLSHGRDDVCGGLARVTKVTSATTGGKHMHWITVREFPQTRYNWEGGLALEQAHLKERHGTQRAHPDPDQRPEFNEP